MWKHSNNRFVRILLAMLIKTVSLYLIVPLDIEGNLMLPLLSFHNLNSLYFLLLLNIDSGKYGSDLRKQYNISTRNAEGIVLYTHSAGVYNVKLIVPHTLGDQVGYTNRVHTFGKEWDLLAPGFESVHFDTWSWFRHGIQAWLG